MTKNNIKFHPFKSNRCLDGVVYADSKPKERKDKPVKSQTDIMFEKIFALDECGFPQPTLAVYLSEKTSDDVRKFIEQNILVSNDVSHAINDEKIVSQFDKLSSEFIAESSRNKGESIEAYEKRLQDIITRDDAESFHRKFTDMIKKYKGDNK